MNFDQVRDEILNRINNKDLSKKRLGEILGSLGNEFAKIKMANRFLKKLEEGTPKTKDVEAVLSELNINLGTQINGNNNITNSGNSTVTIGDTSNKELTPREFMNLSEQERKDYLEFLRLSK